MAHPKRKENVDHPESKNQQQKKDSSGIAGEILQCIDYAERKWLESERSHAIRSELATYTERPLSTIQILQEFPQEQRTCIFELILLNDKATSKQLNELISSIPPDCDFIDARIAEIAFLIRSEFLQTFYPQKHLILSDLYPIPRDLDYSAAIYTAKLFFERGQLPKSELQKLLNEIQSISEKQSD